MQLFAVPLVNLAGWVMIIQQTFARINVNSSSFTESSQGTNGIGYFYNDADSVVSIGNEGFLYVETNSQCFVYKSSLILEGTNIAASVLFVGLNDCHDHDNTSQARADFKDSNITLTQSSFFWACPFTMSSITSSKVYMDGSTISLYNFGSLVFDGATVSMFGCLVETGIGAQFLITQSNLTAEFFFLSAGEHSVFNMTGGSILAVSDSDSFIHIGKRAELHITADCLFAGKLTVPDYTVMIIDSTTFTNGFFCFCSRLALQKYVANHNVTNSV